ncbi:MAG TPA: STING domain-containing protein [Chthoniobacterales bacterium]
MKTCFVIGPMGEGHLDRLKWLAKEVLQPILGDDYTVFTPDVNEPGNIMHHVIRSCDRADLVVADTTGNNPNVLYEMAILDAMGRACIPVKFKIDEKADAMVFDRAQYRYFPLEQEKSSAQTKLKEVIEAIRKQRDAGQLFGNPITDFFGDPLNSLASARGLARGYFRNLVTPLLKGKVVEGPDFALGKAALQVQTLLPNRLRQATREAVEKVFKEGRITNIVVEAPGRKITGYIWTNHQTSNGDPVIVDVPTTMASLFSNVYARLGRGTMNDPNSADFRALEDNEIGQFVRYLTIFRNQGAIEDQLVLDNYRIINVADSFEPDLLG